MYDSDDEYDDLNEDELDDFSEADDHEDTIDTARQQAFARGFEAGTEAESGRPGFGWGCLFGLALAFALIYMGWCSPYPFGRN